QFLKVLQIVSGAPSGRKTTSIYFLVGGTPCLVSSRLAWSLVLACSPMASRRMRSWQGSQMLRLRSTTSFPQIMHFFFSSLIEQVSIQHFDLLGIVKVQLNSVLRMFLDFSLNFNFFALDCLRLKFFFFERARRGKKNNRRESLSGRAKI